MACCKPMGAWKLDLAWNTQLSGNTRMSIEPGLCCPHARPVLGIEAYEIIWQKQRATQHNAVLLTHIKYTADCSNMTVP